jgi:hypothetical protein
MLGNKTTTWDPDKKNLRRYERQRGKISLLPKESFPGRI